MLGSQWYYSSQTTGGGASPAFLTCQERSEDAIFSATLLFFFFSLRKVGQEHEDFLEKTEWQRDTREGKGARRGGDGNETCKQESFHHVCDDLFAFVCGTTVTFVRRLAAGWFSEGKQTADMRTHCLCFLLLRVRFSSTHRCRNSLG